MNRSTRWVALLMACALLRHEAAAADQNLRSADLLSATAGSAEISDSGRHLAANVPENNQIRGGFEVTDAIPWYTVFDDTLICGGALIHKDIVVTVAHCVTGGFPAAVRVGSLNLFSGGTRVTVAQGAIHPSWTGTITGGADIAVMKLSSSLTNEVATVNTASSSPAAGSSLFTAGFGLVDNDNLSNSLQGVFLDYVDSCAVRQDAYNPSFHVCGDSSPAMGTCAGDSGSPVVISNSSTVVGLNSYSDSNCESQTIDVYTRVSTYATWVAHQVCTLSDDPPADCQIKDDCWIFNLFGWN